MTGTNGNAVRAFFDAQSYLQRNPIIPIRAAIVNELLADVVDAQVLDLGCGDGSISRPLLARGNQLTLVDFSPRMLESARAATPSGSPVQFVHSDIMTFTPERAYDVVICVGVLAHVPSVAGALTQIRRALRPGGRAIIQITDDTSALGRLLNLYYSIRRSRSSDYRLNVITRAELLDQSRHNDLTEVSMRRYGALIPGLGHLPRGWEEGIEHAFATRRRLSTVAAELIVLFTTTGDVGGESSRLIA